MAGLIYFCVFISLCVYVTLTMTGDAVRCFDCQDVPYPRDCSRVIECDLNEFCYTEQVVTTGGRVVYNSGCLSKSRCSTIGFSLMGKRSKAVYRRSTDLTTCMECCAESFCNRKGCGVKEIPLEQRGPYCFNCDAVLDPKFCDKVAVCMQHEICLLQTASEFQGLPEKVYRSHCEKESVCDGLSSVSGINNCTAKCCRTDFCNDNCDTNPNTSTTTKPTQEHLYSTVPSVASKITSLTAKSTEKPSSSTVPSVTSKITSLAAKSTEKPASSTVPSVASQITESTPTNLTASSTKTPKHCRDHDGYTQLAGHHAHLCVHIVLRHLTWDDARTACKKEGGDLVVLNRYEKSELLRSEIHKHPVYKDRASYWIGAKDFSNNEHYRWIDNNSVHETESDWGHEEPDSARQDCIAMAKTDDFHWNNKNCSDIRNYICEI